MNEFIIGMLAFVVIALSVFLPLSGRIDWQRAYRREQNVALYQRQLRANPPADLADEYAQRLLNDEKQLQNSPHFYSPNIATNHFCYASLLFLLLTLLPLGYYFSLQRFDVAQMGVQDGTEMRIKSENRDAIDKNNDYILTVQNRLRRDPNNAAHWVELGQAYMLNNEFENALIAYNNAAGLEGQKPYLLGLAASAQYYRDGQKITPATENLLTRALQQDPQEISALSLLASDAFLQADYRRALSLWQRILDGDKPETDRRAIIQSMQMAEMLLKAGERE
ncbi:TPR domain-containing protein [Caviibacterium pharyngocola]|uniref:Cytochrome c-type biogenesis protein H TPR domain-containing protein n=1 Tax=Caviibacterium pharyngocola TaxID=28159 RepID=A0A2M8RVB6_9PAST|nr:hypothetical protein [Caviibacterium pharyngocola]PJG82824.1 hypothetical protein CVP04_05500 [Caviibacterium pharyngocola]